MSENLEMLRVEIDRADAELVDLLTRRRDLVRRVGEWKAEHGGAVYVPEREAALLRARREEAAARGLRPDLIEDLLRRILRESYAEEGARGYTRAAPTAFPVTVVGGAGGMGRWFVRLFEATGHPVRVLDVDDWDAADALLADAGLVLVSVPIAVTLEVIAELAGRLPAAALLADVTSVKAAPVAALLAAHPGPVVGLHPMFGPSTPSPAKQVFVRCAGRDADASAWLFEQIALWGATVVDVDPEEHDRIMGTVQALRHFTTCVYGVHLMEERTDLDAVLALSSPIYRLELGMTGRLFAQDPELYADIIFGSAAGRTLARSYHERFGRLLAAYENDDRASFLDAFRRVADWFGPLAGQFLRESDVLLAQARDRIDPSPEEMKPD
jgi:chorismate mutase/prephenate dehydrogenase